MYLAWLIAALFLVFSELGRTETPQIDIIEHQHGFALYGSPDYPADFTHFNYVNPHAPKGGKLKLMGIGTFDSLNPYLLKGISPWKTPGLFVYGFGEIHDTLLAGSDGLRPSGDEPQTAYGLIAESLTYPSHYGWVIFHLNPAARFHDGRPIMAEDVIFSYETLIKEGHPRFQLTYKDVQRVTAIDDRTVKFEFKVSNTPSLILRTGELPILPKHFFANQSFNQANLTPILGNGPYRIDKVDAGKTLVLTRVADYWAKDLPVNRGRYNFDQIQFDFYRDAAIAFEAFKAGHYDIHLDYVSKNWSQNYEFAAIKQGQVIKREIPHQKPQGSQAFFFNTRKPIFKDVRVRQAIGLMFDFEWTNRVLFNSAYRRSQSFFPNSILGAQGAPTAKTLAYLQPYQDQLPPELFDKAFTLPVTKADGSIRSQKRQALALLKTAGWSIKNNQLVQESTGHALSFELVNQHSASLSRIIMPFKKNLASIGIDMNVRMVDAAQYKSILDQFDFDMTIRVLSQGLSPSHELRQYFHSEAANTPGGQNYAGIQLPVVDHLIESIIHAKDRETLTHLVKALDRVLLWSHYTIPHWYIDYFRLAYWDKFAYPQQQPPFILGIQNWWVKPHPEAH